MTKKRLYVAPEKLAATTLELHDADFRYLARVLRVVAGDKVVLFDGEGRESPATVVRVDTASMTLSVGAPYEAAVAELPLTLVCALLKGDKMDMAVQKATELGVTCIAPVTSERSVVRLDAGRAQSRITRWRKIAKEACRQCGRTELPTILPVASFADALRQAPAGLRLLFIAGPTATPLRHHIPERPPDSVVVCVGPEGGFTDDEVALAQAAGFAKASLGPRVLRAETAVIAALAVVGYAV